MEVTQNGYRIWQMGAGTLEQTRPKKLLLQLTSINGSGQRGKKHREKAGEVFFPLSATAWNPLLSFIWLPC
jgi:hypothetical protein